ncbi:hypothetical protein DB88DRAFT_487009 [Papiliotrema laurentii]|uniref:Signal peptidase complex subunit 1 n=1 Tax=Papiliotrema laurentii TaxID=5418 RepID=A0AAD9FRH3_PAPLA|nr:hypothetical protein DB88DRAFT_487009 [Papiliotrema laurentii]
MTTLSPALADLLKGPIDGHAQHLIETWSQFYLAALTIISFIISYLTSAVLVPLELFAGGIIILLFAVVPPWPYLQRHPVSFLPARSRNVQ